MKIIIAVLIFLLLIAAAIFLYTKPSKTSNDVVTTESVEQISKPVIGEAPEAPLKAPQGFEIGVYANGLTNVRDLEFTNNGTLLASQTSQGKVVALPDNDQNGVADTTKEVLNNLRRPHGLAFHNGKLYIAEENQVTRFTYDTSTNTAFFDKKLFDLPSGGRHFTRSLAFDRASNLYVSLGSTCDTCGEKDPYISTVLISNSEGDNLRVFSKGLRNAVFLAVHPESGNVFATEMGRDFLGDNLPPDEINILDNNADFGWPFCYGNQVWDSRFGQKNQEYCNTTIKPFYNIPAHSAPLGLTFINSTQMPEEWQGDLLVSYHGSWNSSTPVGYKVVRISTKGTPQESDFITGFTNDKARPVDVIFDETGSLFVSDDKAGKIYKIINSGN